MNAISSAALTVKCPHCGNKFTAEDALGHDIRTQLEKEFETRMKNHGKALAEMIRKQESERFRAHMQALEEESRLREQRLRELEAASVEIEQRELSLRSREEHMEIEMKRRLIERERSLKEEAERVAHQKVELEFSEREKKLRRDQEMLELQLQKKIREADEKAREEERMRSAELQKKLDDQTRLINEMKRKAEQGSMQMQGEIQELAIESFLRNVFPRDIIEEVAKGKRGADCVHIVRDDFGRVGGRILYESKRTKHFSADWIPKLKEDMRITQADIGVIVTETFPEGMTRFGERDGVWICTFVEFRALASLFRANLRRIGELLASQDNRGEKTRMIYAYVTSNEFRQKLEAAFESYSEMQEDLQREKSMLMSQWAKREKKLVKAMENLISLYGDVRGIAGGAVPEIRCLEIPQNELLLHK